MNCLTIRQVPVAFCSRAEEPLGSQVKVDAYTAKLSLVDGQSETGGIWDRADPVVNLIAIGDQHVAFQRVVLGPVEVRHNKTDVYLHE